MRLFISAEVTGDIGFHYIRELVELTDQYNAQMPVIECEGIDLITAIMTIMNEKLAAPFPGGVIYRKKSKTLDIKAPIDHTAYLAAGTRADRLQLIRAGILTGLKDSRRFPVPPGVVDQVAAKLQSCIEGLDRLPR